MSKPAPSPGDLSLLASAIAGRRTVVHMAQANVAVRYAFSDGHSITLPHDALPAADTWVAVIAQALLMAGGSLDPKILRRMLGRAEIARRYTWLEVQRNAERFTDRLPPSFAARIAHPGVLPTASAQDSLAAALNRTQWPDLPDLVGTVRPMTVLNARTGQATDDSAPATSNGSLRNDQGEPQRTFEEDEVTEESSILKLFSNPFAGRNLISDMLQQILEAGSQRGTQQSSSDQGDSSEMPVSRSESVWRRGINAVLSKLPQGLADLAQPAGTSDLTYPEWSHEKRCYLPDWVSVDEIDPWRADGPRDLAGVLTPPSLRLHRELSQLALNFEMHRKQPEGTEFDTARLLDYATALRTGDTTAKTDVFRASRRTRRDLGVIVLMDSSSSTQECNERGESIFEHLARASYHLARTFDKLGDKVALYAYQSWGRQLVRMVRLKGQEERWSGRIAQRISELETEGFTRTGAAVRHAHHLLQDDIRLPNRLLLLVTDGFSYDNDYDGIHAEEDTRRALAEAREQGTACVCICIGGTLEARKLERVFGSSNLLMVDNADQIDARIRPLCQQALAKVSHRRLHVTHAPTTHHATP
ncbi:MAG TPA: VWA domain-containing protein [Macromonas sp.]|nr:VWA domain-containing protein [Macromonas sp.]